MYNHRDHGEPIYDDLCSTLLKPDGERSEKVAYALAVCAGYAYAQAHGSADTDTLSERMAKLGLTQNTCKSIELSVDAMCIDSTAYLLRACEDKVAVLCYRGTEILDPVDWLTNIDTEPETYAFPAGRRRRNGVVHSGFYRSTRATLDEVVAELLNPAPEVLYITGHSLGGAMAAMTAVMLRMDPRYAQLKDTLRAVYTYGQPMIGDAVFAEECQEDPFLATKVYRHVHRHDIVPHLPPVVSGSFTHFGTEFRFLDGPPGQEAPSGSWREHTATRQAGIVGSSSPVLDFVGRRVPLVGAVITRSNRLSEKGETLAQALHMPFVRWPSFVCYSIEDHAPHHYIAKLATEGVLSEFERVPDIPGTAAAA